MLIIEGLDGTGKTTLVNDLLKHNYKLVKPNDKIDSQYIKYKNLIENSDNKSVSDRSFISEMVYGKVLSGKTKLSEEEFNNLISTYSKYKTQIIYLYASKETLLKRRNDDLKDKQVLELLYQDLMDEFQRRLEYISSYIDIITINTDINDKEHVLSKILK